MQKLITFFSVCILIMFTCLSFNAHKANAEDRIKTYKDKDVEFFYSVESFGFLIAMNNNTNSEIFIDWSDLYIIKNGKQVRNYRILPVGGIPSKPENKFLVLPKSSNMSERFCSSDDIIHLVGKYFCEMERGTYGIYVKFKIGSKEKTIKLTIDL